MSDFMLHVSQISNNCSGDVPAPLSQVENIGFPEFLDSFGKPGIRDKFLRYSARNRNIGFRQFAADAIPPGNLDRHIGEPGVLRVSDFWRRIYEQYRTKQREREFESGSGPIGDKQIGVKVGGEAARRIVQ